MKALSFSFISATTMKAAAAIPTGRGIKQQGRFEESEQP
jgi:hypothetical protein